jgi:hypothetical protein
MHPLLEHTMTQLYTKEKLSDLYKDIPIATQCGLLSAHSNLPAVTCMTVLVELFYSLKRMNPLLEHTMHKLYTNEKLSDY